MEKAADPAPSSQTVSIFFILDNISLTTAPLDDHLAGCQAKYFSLFSYLFQLSK